MTVATISFEKLYSGFYRVTKNGDTVGYIDSCMGEGRVGRGSSNYRLYDIGDDPKTITMGTIHHCKKKAIELFTAR